MIRYIYQALIDDDDNDDVIFFSVHSAAAIDYDDNNNKEKKLLIVDDDDDERKTNWFKLLISNKYIKESIHDFLSLMTMIIFLKRLLYALRYTLNWKLEETKEKNFLSKKSCYGFFSLSLALFFEKCNQSNNTHTHTHKFISGGPTTSKTWWYIYYIITQQYWQGA